MENKYVKYFLIAGVIAVWGGIVFRVVKGLSQSDKPVPIHTASKKVNYETGKDTFSLALNYPDPFIPGADSIEMEAAIKTTAPVLINVPVINQDSIDKENITKLIQYSGLIRNREKKTKIAIVSIHGQEFWVKENERKEGVLIKKIEKERMRVVYKGKVFSVERVN